MNKKKLHHVWKKLKPISYWYFLLGFIITGAIAISALRQNNLTALKLRDQVSLVDKQNGDVETALRNLRKYVYAHMNTDLAGGTNIYPPIQLKYRYERLVQTEKDRVSTENTKIYNDAQRTCEQQFPEGLSGRGRVPCIQQYVDTHGLKEQPIPDALYKFDFASPVWSPDLAGWGILVAVLFFMLFVVRFGLERWLQHNLKTHE